MYNLLNLERVEKLINEIKARFVQKVSGKDLSTNDYSDLDKQKLDGIESNSQKNIIELIKKNGSNLSIDSNKAVDIIVPTKLSQLTNDKTYKTEGEIRTLIQDVGRLKKEVVAELPTIGDADSNTMYLVESEGGVGFAEYIVINGAWEKLGDTGSIDFTQYVKHSDITIITEAQIDAMFNA